jgi:flavodoxin I
MTISIIYGSDGGVTRKIANKIAAKLSVAAIDIKKAQTSHFENCTLLILGCPTYADGDLQTDWIEHLGKLEEAKLTNKRVAIFGMGDQQNYPESFVDAIGILHDIVTDKGAKVVGFTSPEGFDYTKSAALRDGQFVGLALDEDNQKSQTDARINAWLAQIK